MSHVFGSHVENIETLTSCCIYSVSVSQTADAQQVSLLKSNKFILAQARRLQQNKSSPTQPAVEELLLRDKRSDFYLERRCTLLHSALCVLGCVRARWCEKQKK